MSSPHPFRIALSVRTDYSIGESPLQVGTLVKQAQELGYSALGIVDTMTVSAMPAFVEKCKKAEIRPVIGTTLRVVDTPVERIKSKDQGLWQPKVYARTERGMQQLYRLLSKGLSKDYFYYHARVGVEDVVTLGADESFVSEDLVFTTGDLFSVLHHPKAEEIVYDLASRFKVYVELVALDTPLFDKLNARAVQLAAKLKLPLVAGRPVFYASPEDADSADVLRAISTNTDVRSIWVPRPFVRDQALLPLEVVARHYKSMFDRLEDMGVELPQSRAEIVQNSVALFEDCGYEYAKLPPSLPKMAENEFSELTKRVVEGWRQRFSRPVWGHKPATEDLPKYKERLAYELDVLRKLNFSGYFLLVQHIVRWSKEQGIMVGPGRGSVGGSLVAYLMGITDIDPIRFDLLFERFINPDRIDLPDADLDFMSRRRHEIVEMVTKQFGADHVCGIVNFNTLGPASALRDTARLHGLSPIDYSCSKLVEKEHGVPVPLQESLTSVPEIEKFAIAHPLIWNHALRLEGANRALGRHAAGVVIAAEPVINRGVISTTADQAVVQWDKSRVEDFGLIKIDVLGLNTLDVIDAVLAYIKERHHKSIDVLQLPLDDKRVLKAFAEGDTTGVFQFEGGGMKKLLRDLGVGGDLTFDDICAATALFRPGPLDAGLCDRYVQVKQGAATPYYEHPALEECLGDTFGVIVYQEQVMKICRVLCGFTPGEADGVRKAIGKKDAEKMATFEVQFVEGAVKSGMTEFAAKALWDMILGFAGYAFNKSHSYEYSLISWITMWLKVYYPAEFYAGALSIVEDDDKQAALITDARTKGLHIMPPDILVSTGRIEISGEDTLYAPFHAVKGISEATSLAIVEMREKSGGSFTWVPEKEVLRRRKDKTTGKFGLVKEVDPPYVAEMSPEKQKEVFGRSRINAAAIERLDKVGAFHRIAGGLAPMHPDRLRDRLELMPGFTVDVVKADRSLSVETFTKIKLLSLLSELPKCDSCSLKGKPHPSIRMGEKPKFMMVFDMPNWRDEKDGQLLAGENGEVVKRGLRDAGLRVADGYYTALVKAVKPKEQRAISNEQINGCSKWLDQELELLKPPVIVAMGSNAVRYFAPGVKGTPVDLAGKTVYRSDLDATIIFGINPGMLFHDPTKIKQVEAVFAKLAETINP